MVVQFWFLDSGGDVGGCGVKGRGRKKNLKENRRRRRGGEEDESCLVITRVMCTSHDHYRIEKLTEESICILRKH